MKSEQLEVGMTIRFEYGDYGNIRKIKVEEIADKGEYIVVRFHTDGFPDSVCFDKGKEVCVLEKEGKSNA